MSGYVGNDGSQLAGGVNPSGQVQGLSVDASGKLNVNASVSSGPTNITQVNGTAVSHTNGLPVGGDNGTSVVVLPLEALNNLLKASLYGKNANPGDTPLAVDSSGRLLTANYIGGSPVGTSNPYPSADQIRLWCANGQCFRATTGKQSGPGSGLVGISLFNPATQTTKSIYIFSIRVQSAAAAFHQLQATTSDPALTGVTPTVTNLKAGGPASVIPAANITATNTTRTADGTIIDTVAAPGNQSFELLTPGTVIVLPPGAANGIEALANLSGTNNWSITLMWAEV